MSRMLSACDSGQTGTLSVARRSIRTWARCYYGFPMSKLKLRNDVTIGPLKPEYAAHMLAWVQDPEIASNIGLTETPSIKKTQNWIANALQGTSVWPYAIFVNARHVGNVVFDQVDMFLKSARLSVYVGEKEARGRGVGLTAMYRALQACFGERNLHKVWLTV